MILGHYSAGIMQADRQREEHQHDLHSILAGKMTYFQIGAEHKVPVSVPASE